MLRINTLYQRASFRITTFYPDCIPAEVHPENGEPCESDASSTSTLSDAKNRKPKFDPI